MLHICGGGVVIEPSPSVSYSVVCGGCVANSLILCVFLVPYW